MTEQHPPEPSADHASRASQDAAGGTILPESVLPLGVRIAAAWSWRLILIGVAVAALLWLVIQVRILVIPLFIAVLLTALLQPIVRTFERRNWPRWMGIITALLSLGIAVGALITLIVSQLRVGMSDVTARSTHAWFEFVDWLEVTFGLSPAEINAFFGQTMNMLQNNRDQIWNGALAITTTAGQLLAGALLTLFSLIFLLIDGKRIWYWVLGFLPARAHAAVDVAGNAGWRSVGQYVRVQIFVAFVDAVGIGLGAAILGVPFAVPIAILVFLGSFIPFLGAIVTGALAAFVALVYIGPVAALIMLGIVVLVNQIEGHILQPLVMGSAVKVHPLGVVFAVSGGAFLAGIPGALFAVPIAAAASAMVNAIVERKWDPEADPVAAHHARERAHRDAKHRARAIQRSNRQRGSQ